MRDKHRSRLLEWFKNLLIVLLALSALFLLDHIQFSVNSSGGILSGLRSWLSSSTAVMTDSASTPTGSAVVYPVRLAVYEDGQRYGIQYDQAGADAAFASLSTLLSEALGSAGTPEAISERDWRDALCRTGIYADLLYPVSLDILSNQLGNDTGNSALAGSARRICVAEDREKGVSLYYINEDDGSYYTCRTTLSREFHLQSAVADWSPNGALFAFEADETQTLAPYTLLTSTPEPPVYQAGNPLLQDSSRVSSLLSALTFHTQSGSLDPVAGGQIVEGNDSLRLSRNGRVTFHAIGSADFRFVIPGESTQDALDYVQRIAESTAGAWCGNARLCLSDVAENGGRLEITFQYCLNGSPVALPDGSAAAHFVVQNGAVTDLSLFLRTYTSTGETWSVLPEVQAAAAMSALKAQGKELVLLYEDTGADTVRAGWIAE